MRARVGAAGTPMTVQEITAVANAGQVRTGTTTAQVITTTSLTPQVLTQRAVVTATSVATGMSVNSICSL